MNPIETPEYLRHRSLQCAGNDYTIVSLSGNLTADRVAEIETFFLRSIASGRRNMVLDGEGLAYASSTGFGLLLHVANLLRDRGGDLKLANLSPAVARGLRMLSLNRFLDTWVHVDDALAAFHRASAQTPTDRLVALAA